MKFKLYAITGQNNKIEIHFIAYNIFGESSPLLYDIRISIKMHIEYKYNGNPRGYNKIYIIIIKNNNVKYYNIFKKKLNLFSN